MVRIQCLFVDERVDLFSSLAFNLGADFSFVRGELEELTCSEGGIIDAALNGIDVIIFGLHLPSADDYRSRLHALEKLAANPAGVPVVAFLPTAERELVLDAVAAGAYDCFAETSPLGDLAKILRRGAQFSQLRRDETDAKTRPAPPAGFSSIVTNDPNMIALLRLAARVAGSDANVLITGETGTGKEVLARAMHRASQRALSPFVAVACASLPESLIEAELFGHEKGAFTGAVATRRGRFEVAEQGTIFLDEVGELTPALQVKLLRVLQEKKFERLGSNQSRPMQARVICATHRDLAVMMKSGAFRADLYYRFNTVEIELPPLRRRMGDVPLLVDLFFQRHSQRHNRRGRRVSPAAMAALTRHSWPGNIRELEHAVERAVVLCEGLEILPEHLPNVVCQPQKNLGEPDILSFEIRVREFKRQLIHKALELSCNNKVQAARMLNLSRSSLHRLIDELGDESSSEDAELSKGTGAGAA